MNLSYWSGLTIHVLMIESSDGMLDRDAAIQTIAAAGAERRQYELAMQRRIDGFTKATSVAASSANIETSRIGDALYSLIPSPLGMEPEIIASWPCSGGMTAVASSMPLPHLHEASRTMHIVTPSGTVVPL